MNPNEFIFRICYILKQQNISNFLSTMKKVFNSNRYKFCQMHVKSQRLKFDNCGGRGSSFEI